MYGWWATSYVRGHKIYWKDGRWFYADDDSPYWLDRFGKKRVERPCKRCGRMPTPEGYDACKGYIPGMSSVCCGHGVEEALMVPRRRRLRAVIKAKEMCR